MEEADVVTIAGETVRQHFLLVVSPGYFRALLVTHQSLCTPITYHAYLIHAYCGGAD